MARAAPYRHFPTRMALLRAAAARAAGPADDPLEALAGR
jgi:AcrR family transcriptional regulator